MKEPGDDYQWFISGGNTILIAVDRFLRGQGIKKGYLALPHPSIAALGLSGKLLYSS